MLVILSPVADAELDDIRSKYKLIRPELAEALIDEFEHLIQIIANYPQIGIPFRKKYRIFAMTKFPYYLVCYLKAERAIIIHVLHNDRHPKHRTKRKK